MTTAPALVDPAEIAAVRHFNRFYTRRIDILTRRHLATRFSLAESRVLYELAQADATARALAADLGLDQGYLSRILRGFEQAGLIRRERSVKDGRMATIALTEAGHATYAGLAEAAIEAVGAMLAPLSTEERAETVAAMRRIEGRLDPDAQEGSAGGDGSAAGRRAPAFVLRPHRPGDIGHVVGRQSAFYAQEFGWDGTYEALAAEICADFLRNFDPRRDAAWMAERDGTVVGSVFLVGVRETAEAGVTSTAPPTAKLRLLYVDAEARGLGIGRALVTSCIAQARGLGYERLTLWTNDVLVTARRLYEQAGFRLVGEERHHSFGQDLVGQTFDLDLRAAQAGEASRPAA